MKFDEFLKDLYPDLPFEKAKEKYIEETNRYWDELLDQYSKSDNPPSTRKNKLES